MRFARLVFCLFLVGVLGSCSTSPPSPNIVLILVDDLGWKDVGFMGSSYYETPHIDQLAREGMVFTNAYANAPNCAPTRAALLSGQYAPRHGVYTVGSPERGLAHLRRLIPTPNTTELDTTIVTVAEALREVGYATAHIGKWHMGNTGFLPTDQGFDINIAGDHWGHPPNYFSPYTRGNRRISHLPDNGQAGQYLTDRLTDEALAFVDTNREQPFLLYFAPYAVHTPLQAPQDVIDKYAAKPGDAYHNHPTYAAMIEKLDANIGRLLARLDSLHLTNNTVVIFTSDNGGYGPATSMHPLRGSKGMLYEGGIRVPLAVRWPEQIAPGSRSDVPTISLDLYPTLLELAHGSPSPTHTLDGLSLRPLFSDAPSWSRDTLYWHFPAYLQAYRGMDSPWRTTPAGAIRIGDYKLIEYFEDNHLELYNLRTDIGETTNLADRLPDKTEALYTALKAWRTRLEAPVPTTLNPAYTGP